MRPEKKQERGRKGGRENLNDLKGVREGEREKNQKSEGEREREGEGGRARKT